MKLLNNSVLITLTSCIFATGTVANAEPSHGISMSGSLALPADFTHFPQTNPDAPQGGGITYGELGSFDSFGPFILKGKSPYPFRVPYVFESLMHRNYDEPFSLYCLICETIDTPDDRSSVTFTLRPEARFSDGTPITPEDVIWSFETLGEKGVPRYGRTTAQIESIEKTGENSLTFTLKADEDGNYDRELPLIIGLFPILPQHDWEGRDFAEGATEPTIGSGPYLVDDYEMGSFITLRKNPDYWADGLPAVAGHYNLDTITFKYFGQATAIFEALTAGEISIFYEGDAKRWNSYDFPRFTNGEVVKSIVPHQRPSGMYGLVMNTRREKFQDWRVREALITLFNFPFYNATLNAGEYPRIESYFDNSLYAMDHGPAEGKVRALLEPFADTLPPGAIEGYTLPAGEASGRNRQGTRTALQLFQEAGYSVENGVMTGPDGQPFTFDIVMVGNEAGEAAANIYADALKSVGITPTISLVDQNTLTDRRQRFDYDMMDNYGSIWALSLSPGNEQWNYWGSGAATAEGTRNYAGIQSEAVDAMITAMLQARTTEDYIAAVKALDRILMAGRYVIPFWYNPEVWLAHDANLTYNTNHVPIYGFWNGFAPDIWWSTDAE